MSRREDPVGTNQDTSTPVAEVTNVRQMELQRHLDMERTNVVTQKLRQWAHSEKSSSRKLIIVHWQSGKLPFVMTLTKFSYSN